MALRAVLDHPKFTDLQARIGKTKAETLGYLECLWHFTGRYTPQGNIGKYTPLQIEAWVGWDGEPGYLIYSLIQCHWIDIHVRFGMIIHDWHKHADSATRKHLTRTCVSFLTDVEPKHLISVQTLSRQLPELSGQNWDMSTPPESGAESGAVIYVTSEHVTEGTFDLVIAEPESKNGKEPKPYPEYEGDFEEFWLAYPRRAGNEAKNRARIAYGKARKAKIDKMELLAGANRCKHYHVSLGKEKTSVVPMASTFLSLKEEAWKSEWAVDGETSSSEGSSKPELTAAEIARNCRYVPHDGGWKLVGPPKKEPL